MKNNELEIQQVWKTEQEILDVFHKICLENNLRYTLAYGTLLGAVRHGGFIPWDDDIDVLMPCEDYERLIKIWKKVAPENYLLQDYHTEKDYTNNFAKIRKNHTTFIQYEYEKKRKYHTGIFIDIFPCYRIAEGTLSRKIQYAACAVNLLYSRGFSSGSRGGVGVIESLLLKVSKDKQRIWYDRTEKFVKRWNKQAENHYFVPVTIEDCKKIFPSDLFNSLTMLTFNGKKYCVTQKFDVFLKESYGDYMKFPPKEERRWMHHPIIVDFERNYEELSQ